MRSCVLVAAVLSAASAFGSDKVQIADATPRSDTQRQAVVTGNPAHPPIAKDQDPVGDWKHPTDWLSLGADLRLRQEYGDNIYLRSSDPPGDTVSWQRYRARFWDTIRPLENVEINSRLAWEGRYTFEPDSREGWDPSFITVDNLNVRVRSGTDSRVPTTLTVGRQDIQFGDGWLVFDGTPVDGSRTIYFDAARATIDLKSATTTMDVIYLHQSADPDEGLSPIDISAGDCKAVAEQDEQGAILYLSNKAIKDTAIEPYFIYKHDDAFLSNGDTGDVYTFGTRATRELSKHWRARAEGAYQFGTRDNPALFPHATDNDLSAFGGTARLTYLVRDAWDTQLYVGYEFLSGDDPSTRTNEQFDPLWGRWPQWSDLLTYTAVGSESRYGEISNLQRINLGIQTSPSKKVTLCANYNALFSVENPRSGDPGFGDDSFRGHLMSATLKYKLNRFLSGHATAEYFLPGDFYSDDAGGSFSTRDDPAAFFRVEMIVTF